MIDVLLKVTYIDFADSSRSFSGFFFTHIALFLNPERNVKLNWPEPAPSGFAGCAGYRGIIRSDTALSRPNGTTGDLPV